ncbi:MAG TPA: 4Fe-4S dicluster domain-containing protein, partial [Candidatus Limnocylindrales bacterium]
PRFLLRQRLGELVSALGTDGRRVIGPVVRDGTIVLDEIDRAEELPIGWTLDHTPGRVSLQPRQDRRAFGFSVPGMSWKQFTLPPRVDSLSVQRAADGAVRVQVVAAEPEPIAFLGARACELAALAIQDRVLGEGPAADPDYAARRADVVIAAVECAVAGRTCFCTSMGSGPEITGGADLVLSELGDGFVVRTTSPAGTRLIAGLALPVARDDQIDQAAAQVGSVRAAIGDPVATDGLPGRLLANLAHPRWAEVAERCLACGNCTAVCPTCFCTRLAIRSDLDGTESVAERTLDSCFTEGFASVAGGNFRPAHADRYRQWLTHKFATWWDQFGTAGCVGCGRCIAWCPVGIDVRQELAVIAGPAVATLTPTDVAAVRTTTEPRTALPLDFAEARVVDVVPETIDTMTLRLATDYPALIAGRPGQFVMAALPAFAIPPISISRFQPDCVELTIRAAGPASSALARLRTGAAVALRGPLGRGWPVEAAEGRDVVIVAGGIGLAPLRPLIDHLIAARERYGAIRLDLGARTPRDRLFVSEMDDLAARGDVEVVTTVDRAGPEWFGRVGIVTQLFDRAEWDGSAEVAYVCGPERMMHATVDVLEERGLPPDRIWLTLERHMECGVGLCGHCQIGGRFVCRDGPVFSVAELGDDLRRVGW